MLNEYMNREAMVVMKNFWPSRFHSHKKQSPVAKCMLKENLKGRDRSGTVSQYYLPVGVKFRHK